MQEWPDIQFTSTHQELFHQLNKRCGGPCWYSNASRAEHSKGFHRLIDLVPGMFPDQEKLARTLAECAIANRRSDVRNEVPFIVRKRFECAQRDDDGIQRLVQDARRQDWVAWEACRLYRETTTELVKTQDGAWEKSVRPVPAPVQQLALDYFLDGFPRPGPKKPGPRSADSVSYHGAIILSVWMACESELTPTSRIGPSGCRIVSELLGLPVTTVNGIWSKRGSKPSGTPRN